MAPGLEFTRGTTPVSSIVLPLQGNATSATFWAKAEPKAMKLGVVHLLATFSYRHDFLARIQRDIQIKGATPAPASEAPPPTRRTVKSSGAVLDTAAEFNAPAVPPDLTLIIKGDGIEVFSPYFNRPVTGTMPNLKGFPEWLAQHAPVNAGRGTSSSKTPRRAAKTPMALDKSCMTTMLPTSSRKLSGCCAMPTVKISAPSRSIPIIRISPGNT